MTSRKEVAKYMKLAETIRATYWPHDEKVKVIANYCKELKKADSRFDSEKFQAACWGEEW